MWPLGLGHRIKRSARGESKSRRDRLEQCDTYQQTYHFSRADSEAGVKQLSIQPFLWQLYIPHYPQSSPCQLNLITIPKRIATSARPPQSSQTKQPQGLTEALVTPPWLCNLPLKYLANLNMNTLSPQSCDWRFHTGACHSSTASERNRLGRNGLYECALIYTERPFKRSPAILSVFWKHFFRNKL